MVERKNSIGIIDLIIIAFFIGLLGFSLQFAWIQNFNRRFSKIIYPNVSINGINFGGKTPVEVKNYWLLQNKAFNETSFTFNDAVDDISKTTEFFKFQALAGNLLERNYAII